MSESLPRVYLARHGETAWTLSRQHTGRTDIPLTARGEANARSLGERLKDETFELVFVSPLGRARRTCELAGFGARARPEADLLEWDYGAYEGRTTAEIRAERPGWYLFRDGCPGGESPQQIAARADRVAHRLRTEQGNVLVFSSRHFMLALAVRWIGVETMSIAESLTLSTSSLSALGYKDSLSQPAIQLWNETHYLLASTDNSAPTEGPR